MSTTSHAGYCVLAIQLMTLIIYRTVAPTMLFTLQGISVPSTFVTNANCGASAISGFFHDTVKSDNVVKPGCTVSKIFFLGGRTDSAVASPYPKTYTFEPGYCQTQEIRGRYLGSRGRNNKFDFFFLCVSLDGFTCRKNHGLTRNAPHLDLLQITHANNIAILHLFKRNILD